ncbi:MAG: hypothetical protein KF678_04405 [Phycisphaeraceae bacterium]|nr:hypothetical protein [Phycisphaeraceae bacterium]
MNSSNEILQTISRINRRRWRSPDVREVWAGIVYRLAGTPDRKARTVKRLKIGGPVVVLALAAAAYFVFRPVPQPDYRKARLDKVFNYTLLTDEFNRLPVEKRLELMGQLVERLQGMSAGDSALMAAFAAGIAGSARKQIEENASRLMIDVWDKYAKDYAKVKPEDRGAFLDHAFLEFTRMGEAISGRPSTRSDAERLAQVREQAKRDEERLRSGERQPPAQALGRMFTFMNENVGSHASISQRTRGQQMMRDMVRRFRGEDVGGGGR